MNTKCFSLTRLLFVVQVNIFDGKFVLIPYKKTQ